MSLDRLSPEAVLALSGTMGNSALAELIAGRERPADRTFCPTPAPLPDMDAAVLGEGDAGLTAPVDFAALPPLEAGAGLAMGGW